ncbi:MAG: hypothetical protein V1859_09640 [archaeon]
MIIITSCEQVPITPTQSTGNLNDFECNEGCTCYLCEREQVNNRRIFLATDKEKPSEIEGGCKEFGIVSSKMGGTPFYPGVGFPDEPYKLYKCNSNWKEIESKCFICLDSNRKEIPLTTLENCNKFRYWTHYDTQFTQFFDNSYYSYKYNPEDNKFYSCDSVTFKWQKFENNCKLCTDINNKDKPIHASFVLEKNCKNSRPWTPKDEIVYTATINNNDCLICVDDTINNNGFKWYMFGQKGRIKCEYNKYAVSTATTMPETQPTTQAPVPTKVPEKQRTPEKPKPNIELTFDTNENFKDLTREELSKVFNELLGQKDDIFPCVGASLSNKVKVRIKVNYFKAQEEYGFVVYGGENDYVFITNDIKNDIKNEHINIIQTGCNSKKEELNNYFSRIDDNRKLSYNFIEYSNSNIVYEFTCERLGDKDKEIKQIRRITFKDYTTDMNNFFDIYSGKIAIKKNILFPLLSDSNNVEASMDCGLIIPVKELPFEAVDPSECSWDGNYEVLEKTLRNKVDLWSKRFNSCNILTGNAIRNVYLTNILVRMLDTESGGRQCTHYLFNHQKQLIPITYIFNSKRYSRLKCNIQYKDNKLIGTDCGFSQINKVRFPSCYDKDHESQINPGRCDTTEIVNLCNEVEECNGKTVFNKECNLIAGAYLFTFLPENWLCFGMKEDEHCDDIMCVRGVTAKFAGYNGLKNNRCYPKNNFLYSISRVYDLVSNIQKEVCFQTDEGRNYYMTFEVVNRLVAGDTNKFKLCKEIENAPS